MEHKSFTFLITGVRDNDCAVYNYAENGHIVFFKLPYTPPYAEFQGIRGFQTAVRFRPFEHTTKYENSIAVNLSEWTEHADEEYLEIFMKYLHDFRDGGFYKQFFFTIGDKARTQAEPLFRLATKYLSEGSFHEDDTLCSQKALSSYLLRHYRLDDGAAELAARILLQHAADYVMINSVMNDLQKKSSSYMIHKEALLNGTIRQSKFELLFENDLNHLREKLERRQENEK